MVAVCQREQTIREPRIGIQRHLGIGTRTRQGPVSEGTAVGLVDTMSGSLSFSQRSSAPRAEHPPSATHRSGIGTELDVDHPGQRRSVAAASQGLSLHRSP